MSSLLRYTVGAVVRRSSFARAAACTLLAPHLHRASWTYRANSSSNHESIEAAVTLDSKSAYERIQSFVESNKGVSPYGQPVVPTLTVQEFINKYSDALDPGTRDESTVLTLTGRVMSKREASGKLVFLDLVQEGERVQIMATARTWNGWGEREESITFIDALAQVKRGDVVRVTGVPAKTKVGELSLVPSNITTTSICLHDLPHRSNHLTSPETRYRNRALDMIVNPQVKDVFLKRTAVIKGIRSYLDDKGFLEVETPVLSAHAGGASARPFRTHHWALGTDLYLRIAPELFLKQLVIGGFDKVYELGRLFRNEGIDATHNPEFTSCEFYMAHASLDTARQMTEELLVSLSQLCNGSGNTSVRVPIRSNSSSSRSSNSNSNSNSNSSSSSSSSSDEEGQEVSEIDHVTVDLGQTPYHTLPVVTALEEACGLGPIPRPLLADNTQAIQYLQGAIDHHSITLENPEDYHNMPALIDTLLSHLVEPTLIQPTFLTEYPVLLSPLARRLADNPHQDLCERFELFVGGRELCNAYGELADPQEQRYRLQQQQQQGGSTSNGITSDNGDVVADEPFLHALEYGLPPTTGWGLGVDRLVMLLTETASIRDVTLFPLMKPKAVQ